MDLIGHRNIEFARQNSHKHLHAKNNNLFVLTVQVLRFLPLIYRILIDQQQLQERIKAVKTIKSFSC
jgi:hypothetical protein